MNIAEVKARLVEGNQRFVADAPRSEGRDLERRELLTQGQSPHAVILSCADSRVVPELVFDAGLGELFVVRVAGNIANTSSVASIEFAVSVLGAKLVVVLGHESCGAVAAAMEGKDLGHNLNHLVAHIEPALAGAKDADSDELVCRNAQRSAQELLAKSSILEAAVESGQLEIASAFYRLGTGEVVFL